MRKWQIRGESPDLNETARRLNMSSQDLASVQRIVAKVVQMNPDRSYSLKKRQHSENAIGSER